MPQKAYVEDYLEDDFAKYEDYEGDSDDEKSPAEQLPEAPTPPPAVEGNVNVFDFLDNTMTPNASNLNLPHAIPVSDSTELVRYDYEANAYLDPNSYMESEALVQYGTGPIPSGAYQTPLPKGERKKGKDGDLKKDKKRKRLHVAVPGDQIMTDAPPVLHSGLTGGLNRLMRPIFPPSPDYSGGDGAEPSPASPLKKTRHSKHSKSGREGIGNNLLALMTSGTKTKTKTKKRKSSSSSSTKKHRSQHRSETEKAPKLIEYRPQSRDTVKEGEGNSSEMVVYRPRADLFLSFINKGPESERGCSMNKALKRFHRERTTTGSSLGKLMEEKELWRSLRMRRNDRGEIVLFCV
jgi:cell growth-regulating nucleolar protein